MSRRLQRRSSCCRRRRCRGSNSRLSSITGRFSDRGREQGVSLARKLHRAHNKFFSTNENKNHLPEKIRIVELNNHGDARGFSFAMPREALDFVGQIGDMLMASIAPGAVRGNHYHASKRQANVIYPGSAWSLHWDNGEGTTTQHRDFNGTTATLVL